MTSTLLSNSFEIIDWAEEKSQERRRLHDLKQEMTQRKPFLKSRLSKMVDSSC